MTKRKHFLTTKLPGGLTLEDISAAARRAPKRFREGHLRLAPVQSVNPQMPSFRLCIEWGVSYALLRRLERKWREIMAAATTTTPRAFFEACDKCLGEFRRLRAICVGGLLSWEEFIGETQDSIEWIND